MTLGHLLPGSPQRIRLQRSPQIQTTLHHISPTLRFPQSVIQHALLHGGQGIEIFDIPGLGPPVLGRALEQLV